MASRVAYASGTTAAVVDLVVPPGRADDAIGYKYCVIDSITIAHNTTGVAGTAGYLAIQTNAPATIFEIFNNRAQAANTFFSTQYTWPGGLMIPHNTGGTTYRVRTELTSGATAYAVVTYHFE